MAQICTCGSPDLHRHAPECGINASDPAELRPRRRELAQTIDQFSKPALWRIAQQQQKAMQLILDACASTMSDADVRAKTFRLLMSSGLKPRSNGDG